MVDRTTEDGGAVAVSVAKVADRLAARLADLTDSIQRFVVEQTSEFHHDAQLLELLRDNVAGNLNTFFSAVQHGIPIEQVAPPPVALEYARRVAQRGISANALVRGYRLGHSTVIDAVLQEIRAAGFETSLGLDVFEKISAVSFGYLDWISQLVLDEYQTERDRWTKNRTSARALRVREVLEDGDADVDAVSEAIQYPLRRRHLALITWCSESPDNDELTVMERFVQDLAESIDAVAAPLYVAADRVSAWAWIPVESTDAVDAVSRTRTFVEAKVGTPWVVAGQPMSGIEGFRISHRQAQAARVVATATHSEERFTAISDHGVSLAALHVENVDAARVWVGEVLGPLASATEADQRLRETLAVFLRAGSSFKAAAAELHLHSNGVKYRVHRAVERRGRAVTDDRLDVEVALLLCDRFGNAVLTA